MRVLITGVTGSLGSCILDPILKRDDVDEVIGVSRDELKQSKIPKHDKLKLIIGDLRDREKMIVLGNNIDLIIHLGALKRIDTIEDNPYEAVHTNIIGTFNIYLSQIVNNVKKLVFVSTDKASYPINVYGATKLIGERIVLQIDNNVVTRWGNVIGSRGSVVPIIRDKIESDSDIELTDENMIRYWIRIEKAVEFLIKVSFDKDIKGLQIPHEDMKLSKIETLINIMQSFLGKKRNVKIIGRRPGEKLIEDMYTEEDKINYKKEIDAIPFYEREELLKDLIEVM